LGRAIACVFMVWIISHRAMALSFGYGRMPRKKTYPFKRGEGGVAQLCTVE